MCGLCGILGGAEHWAEGRAGDGVAQLGPIPRRAQRLRRVALANPVLAHFSLTLGDWQGVHYVLSNRTGRSEMVDDLAQLWLAAERMLGRACDPLDPALIEKLEREG